MITLYFPIGLSVTFWYVFFFINFCVKKLMANSFHLLLRKPCFTINMVLLCIELHLNNIEESVCWVFACIIPYTHR